jgi:hypothetical protein
MQAPFGHGPRRFVTQRLLGSEAVYEILDERAGLVTAEVVSAPGLAPGMRLRLMANAADAMERCEAPGQPLIAAPALVS